MPRYFAFLRAINVGGHVVRMEALRSHFEAIGCRNVETFIASGNVIFETATRSASVLERRIESCLLECLGYEVATFLRTDNELATLAQYQPFTPLQLGTAAALNIGFLRDVLKPEAADALMALKTDFDDFHVAGRELHWLSRAKQSETKFSNAAFERATGSKVTFRGANTIARLARKYSL